MCLFIYCFNILCASYIYVICTIQIIIVIIILLAVVLSFQRLETEVVNTELHVCNTCF